ncbi:hypothetical protein CEXT_648351 [Caerostris extrusa]|uniref:Uncharacterized protein n=1 Tax=Caerostris extrusa TaxID=172846 RepID=A0AAV4XFB7_CAEEX|nr:hypothetical protein CEXT_648351 [Caerostris extrusa]
MENKFEPVAYFSKDINLSAWKAQSSLITPSLSPDARNKATTIHTLSGDCIFLPRISIKGRVESGFGELTFDLTPRSSAGNVPPKFGPNFKNTDSSAGWK